MKRFCILYIIVQSFCVVAGTSKAHKDSVNFVKKLNVYKIGPGHVFFDRLHMGYERFTPSTNGSVFAAVTMYYKNAPLEKSLGFVFDFQKRFYVVRIPDRKLVGGTLLYFGPHINGGYYETNGTFNYEGNDANGRYVKYYKEPFSSTILFGGLGTVFGVHYIYKDFSIDFFGGVGARFAEVTNFKEEKIFYDPGVNFRFKEEYSGVVPRVGFSLGYLF